jgi:beta-phosphoglucomutase-like phosphatase (HAD superfamily)
LEPAEHHALAHRIPDIHRTKTGIYTRLVCSGEVGLRDGVARLIDDAEQAGVFLGIASTTTYANIEALLSSNLGAGAMRRFAVIGTADQVRRKKPAPDIYEFVMQKLGQPARACVAIEDSGNGLRAAKAAGLFTLITPSDWTRLEDFAAADLVLPALGMLGVRQIDERLTRQDRAN